MIGNRRPQDLGLDRLLDLDESIFEVGGGFWVSIKARKIRAGAAKPHGVNYSLCLISPSDDRVLCFDNAHPIKVGGGPARKRTRTSDHVHEDGKIRPYDYANAESLLDDFWQAVEDRLKKEGIP